LLPKRLSDEWRIPLAIVLHFLDLIFNHNGLIDHVLEIDVIGVEQLELNAIIQLIQEHVVGGKPSPPNEGYLKQPPPVEILSS
jgi:hypothetical protein